MDFRNLSARTGVQRMAKGLTFGGCDCDLADRRDVRGEGMWCVWFVRGRRYAYSVVWCGMARIRMDGKAEFGPDDLGIE